MAVATADCLLWSPTGERLVNRSGESRVGRVPEGGLQGLQGGSWSLTIPALTVAQLQTLRRQMKQAGAQVKVAKNRLAKIALDGSDAPRSRFAQRPT